MTLYYGVQQIDLAGVTAQFGMYFRNTTLDFPFVGNAWSGAMTQLLEVPTALGNPYLDMVNSGDTITYRWVYKIDEFSDRKIDRTDPALDGTAGFSGWDALPRSTSVLTLWHHDFDTHPLGRMYLPRLTVNQVHQGDVDPTSATIVLQCLGQFYTNFTGNLCTPVIRNRKRHTDVPATIFVVSNRFAHLRTRTATSKPSYI